MQQKGALGLLVCFPYFVAIAHRLQPAIEPNHNRSASRFVPCLFPGSPAAARWRRAACRTCRATRSRTRPCVSPQPQRARSHAPHSTHEVLLSDFCCSAAPGRCIRGRPGFLLRDEPRSGRQAGRARPGARQRGWTGSPGRGRSAWAQGDACARGPALPLAASSNRSRATRLGLGKASALSPAAR